MLVATGERIADVRRLAELRATDPGADLRRRVPRRGRPEPTRALLQRALAFPDSIVASDAMHVEWPDGSTDSREWPLPRGRRRRTRAPRGRSPARLRRMVVETGAVVWAEAFRRCSYLPAQVVAGFAPAARTKGWLGVGADADLVVIDPATISDSATYVDPTRPSMGVRHLLVDGTFVVRDGALDVDAFPGRPIRATLG